MYRPSLYSGGRFRRALKHFLFGRLAQGIANLVLTVWVVRLLTLGDYGSYMTLRGLVEMLTPLSSLGLLEATRRYMPDLATRGHAAGVRTFVRWTTLARFLILLAWAGLIAAIWYPLTAWLGFDAGQAEQGWVAVALVVSVLGFRYASEMLETLLEQRWSQLAHALMPIGRLLGVAGLVVANAVSLASVLWVDLVASVLCLVVAELALAMRLRRLDLAGEHRVGAREVMVYAWHMAGVNVLQAFASAGALRMLVARLLGLEAAGLFAFLQQLLIIASRYMPAQLLANVIRPMLISRRAAGEGAVVATGLGMMWKSNQVLVLAGLAILVVAGDGLIGLASGGRYEAAGVVMLLLFLGLGASSQNQLINMAMQIHDKTRALRSQSLLFLLVPALAWLAGAYGLAGFAAGAVTAQWLRNAFAQWWMRRHGVDMDMDFAGVLRVATAFGLVALPCWWLAGQFGQWLALGVSLPSLVAGLWLAKPLLNVEVELLRRALKGKARFLKPFVR